MMVNPKDNHSNVNFQNLKSALDDSSDKNRNFLVAFLVLELYLLITILNVTDRDLLVPDSVLNLPFIALDIPLLGFFILSPLLLVAFFYNLLFNLLEHARTLREWLDHPENERSMNFNLLHAFMLNTRAKYDGYEALGKNKPQVRTVNYYLLNIIIIGTMSVFPLYLLVLIMWKFASYQNYAITIWHSVLVGVCFLLHIVYWLRIQYPKFLVYNHDSFSQLSGNLKYCRIESNYLKLAIILVLIRFIALVATEYPSLRLVLKNPVVNWVVPHLNVSGEKFLNIIQQPVHGPNVARNISIKSSAVDALPAMTSEDIQASVFSSTAIRGWEKICQNRNEFVQTKLQKRAFRLANFSDVVMCNVDMKNADLRGSTMDNAIIGGNLENARLNNTSMRRTKFQPGSMLTAAILDDADLSFAVFKEVDLTLSFARRANFFATQLVDSTMVQMILSGARFTRTNLFRGNMRSAKLYDTTFKHTYLNAVDLRFVSGLSDNKQLIESPIKNCLVDQKVIIPLEENFEFANCEITVNMVPDTHEDKVAFRRIYEFGFNETEFMKMGYKSESTEGFVNNIIDITRLTQSTYIDLSDNDLLEIPTGLLTLSHIEELNLANNQLTSDQIDLLVEYLPQLKKLSLRGLRLEELPESLTQLNQLTSLDLSFTELGELPESIGQLSQLKEFKLGGNRLKELPKSIGQLTQLTILDLSSNGLDKLPESFGKLSQLKELDLGGNSLEALPESFGQLTQMTELKLNGNSLKALPESFGQLTRLTNLDLSLTKLGKLPESVTKLTKLIELNLAGNHLFDLPDSIGQLTKLTELKLNGNRLKGLPETFGQLTQLKKLDLFGYLLAELPESFGKLSQLKELDLGGNSLEALPESFGKLTQLTVLNLEKNRLNLLPESFDQLTQLTELKLNGNRLKRLPETFGQLTQLKKLYLISNQLRTLPESFGHLTQLTELNLGNNQLNALPESFGGLTHLPELNLSINRLTSLPNSFGHLTQLTELDLSSNLLQALPESFGRLTKLSNLDLGVNKLTKLPRTFGLLTQLTELHLSSNQLTELSFSFGRLTQLAELNLRINLLTALPESFGQLTQLTSLNLDNNQLAALPETFGQLTQLTSLYLNNNQLAALPQNFGQLTQLTYFNLNRNQLKALPLSLCKLLSKSLTSQFTRPIYNLRGAGGKYLCR